MEKVVQPTQAFFENHSSTSENLQWSKDKLFSNICIPSDVSINELITQVCARDILLCCAGGVVLFGLFGLLVDKICHRRPREAHDSVCWFTVCCCVGFCVGCAVGSTFACVELMTKYSLPRC